MVDIDLDRAGVSRVRRRPADGRVALLLAFAFLGGYLPAMQPAVATPPVSGTCGESQAPEGRLAAAVLIDAETGVVLCGR